MTTISEVEAYDPMTNSWQELWKMNLHRSALCACVANDLDNGQQYTWLRRELTDNNSKVFFKRSSKLKVYWKRKGKSFDFLWKTFFFLNSMILWIFWRIKNCRKLFWNNFLFNKEFFYIRETFVDNINGLKQEIQGINANNI